MTPSHLTLVPPNGESRARQLQALQEQIRSIARVETAAFASALEELQRKAEEILAAGDAFPVGVREVARTVAEEAGRQSKLLESLASRSCVPGPAASGAAAR